MNYKNIYKTNLDGMCELATDFTLLKKDFVKVRSDKLENGVGLYSVTSIVYDEISLKPINTAFLNVSDDNNYIVRVGDELVKLYSDTKLSKNQKVIIKDDFYVIDEISKTDDKKVKELVISKLMSKPMVYHYKVTDGNAMFYFIMYESALAITMNRKKFYISNTYNKGGK